MFSTSVLHSRMAFGGRIREAREFLGWTAVQLADRSKVPNTTIGALEKRDSKRSQYAEDLVAAFPPDRINHSYVRTGKGRLDDVHAQPSSNVISLGKDDPLPEGSIYIKVSAIAFSGGNGRRTPHYELIPESDPVVYSISWFQKRQINPDNVRRYKVVDDSMEHFLYDGDTVLVNHAETTVRDGKIYAFRYGDDLRIKQIYRRLDGTLILHSFNSTYKDEEVSAELANEHIAIIGRVRDKSGSGGL